MFQEHYPLPGVGHYLIGLGGTHLVLVWAMLDTVTAKTGIDEVFPMLEQLTAAKAAAFMKGSKWFSLEDIVFFIIFGVMLMGSTSSGQGCAGLNSNFHQYPMLLTVGIVALTYLGD